MSYVEGVHHQLDLQINYRYSAETFRIYSCMTELQTCVDTRSDIMRVSHNRTSKLNIL